MICIFGTTLLLNINNRDILKALPISSVYPSEAFEWNCYTKSNEFLTTVYSNLTDINSNPIPMSEAEAMKQCGIFFSQCNLGQCIVKPIVP